MIAKNYFKKSLGSDIAIGETIANTSAQQNDPAVSPPIAVLVFHGMGEQVPFETVDQAVNAVRQQAALQGGKILGQTARLIESAVSGRSPRVELRIEKEGRIQDVHFFEAYWAPLTEGKVKFFEVAAFLFNAGKTGFEYARKGEFLRWMFRGESRFRVSRFTAFLLILITLCVVAFLAIYLTLFGIAMTDGGAHFVKGVALGDAQLGFKFVLYFMAAFVALILACTLISSIGHLLFKGNVGVRRVLFWLMNLLALGFLTFTCILATSLLQIVLFSSSNTLLDCLFCSCSLEEFNTFVTNCYAAKLTFWFVGLGTSVGLRYFTIEYVGDVAAYISAHKASKFYEVRQQIQKVGTDEATLIYEMKGVDGKPFYNEVILVSHSLGTVLAYDTFNALVNSAMASGGVGAAKAFADRTRALLTFGSPLNKTAFIFRNFRKGDPFREALAEAVQPMITDTAYRPKQWINVWSNADWVSGELAYYDDPSALPGSRGVVHNIKDMEAFIPAKAHTEYWDHSEVPRQLYGLL
jgi:hypothetical protein